MLVSPPFGFMQNAGPVPQDGPSAAYCPRSGFDFTQLGILPPQHLYQFQQASPNNFIDSSGIFPRLTMLPNTGPLYRTAFAGWTRVGVGCNQVVSQGMNVSTGSGQPDPSTTSWAIMAYMGFTGAPAVGRSYLGYSGGSNSRIVTQAANGLLSITNGAGTVTGAVDHNDGLVHPLLMVNNRTAGTVKLFTDLETINGTYSNSVGNGKCGWGSFTSASGPCTYMWGFLAGGATAESYSAATLTALGW